MIEKVVATVAKEVAKETTDAAIEATKKEVIELPDKIGGLSEVEALPDRIDIIPEEALQEKTLMTDTVQGKLQDGENTSLVDCQEPLEDDDKNTDAGTSVTSTETETSEKDDAEKKRMEPPVDVQFTCKDKYDRAEYERQVKNQEAGMNNISLYDYQKNREKYKENGRNTDVGGPAQEKVRQEARADKIAEYRREGMRREEAEKKADEWMDTQAALHDPDQIAGGDAANVTDMGDKEINSSIGSQWQYRIEAVDAAVQKYIEENGLSEEDMKNVYLNVKLEVLSE